MALSYAGIALPLSTPALERRLALLPSTQSFRDWNAWWYQGVDTQLLPDPVLPEPPSPLRLGVLCWPRDATRPAWFHCVATTAMVKAIRAVVGNPENAATLAMDDGRPGKSIQAQMYMLPPRPLAVLGQDLSDSWLLTLTDQRFFWPWRPGSIASQPSTWNSLYSQLATILDIDLTPDTVSSAYVVPSPKWVGYFRPAATVLDAVANQVGQKIYCTLDGDVFTANWGTAKGASDAYLASNDIVVAGGLIADIAIAAYVPCAVDTLFASGTVPPVPAQPFVVGTLLTSLDIPEYNSWPGMPSATGTTYADTPFTGSNYAQCTGYAKQASYDWFGWRLQDSDFVFPGIEPWVPTGWEDAIEWTYQLLDASDSRLVGTPSDGTDKPYASTRVRRGPFDERPSGSWAGPSVVPVEPGVGGQQVNSLTLMTGQCTNYASGNVIGSTNQFITVSFPFPVTITNAFCLQSSTNCCSEGGTVACNGGLCPAGLPTTLYVALYGAGPYPDNECPPEGTIGSPGTLLGVFSINYYGSVSAYGCPGPNGVWYGCINLNCPSLSSETPCNTDESVVPPPCDPYASVVLYMDCCQNIYWGAGPSNSGGPCGGGTPANPSGIPVEDSTNNPGCTGLGQVCVASCDPFCAYYFSPINPSGTFPCANWICQSNSSHPQYYYITGVIISSSPAGTCGSPSTTYNCDNITGACVPVYDGSGTYSTLTACQAVCGQSPPPPPPPPGGCPGGPSITVTVSGGTGTCAPCNGSYVLTRDPSSGNYYCGFGFPSCGGVCGLAAEMAFFGCSGSGTLTASVSLAGKTLTVTGTASPLDLTGTVTLGAGTLPCGGQTLMVTVTS